jgi:hypothetical protein
MMPGRRQLTIRLGGIPFLITSGFGVLLARAACAPSPPSSVASGRPACVDLSSHSGVIKQVMGIQPEWEPVVQDRQGYKSEWVIQDDKGKHALSAAITPEGCVCATNATSQFHGAIAQGELAGLLQGATVAPVSQLEYTSRWLEPRVLLSCPLAFLLRRPFASETDMPDGSSWRLACSRVPSSGNAELLISLRVIS